MIGRVAKIERERSVNIGLLSQIGRREDFDTSESDCERRYDDREGGRRSAEIDRKRPLGSFLSHGRGSHPSPIDTPR